VSASNVVQRYVEGLKQFDWDAVENAVHPHITVRYPQSGEVIQGRDNYLAMLRNYPDSDLLQQDIETIHGADESVQVSSPLPFGLSTVTVASASDYYTCQTTITYPDGSCWHGVLILRVLDGKIHEDTSYFAEPFDAPEWRAKYCEALS